MRRTVLSLICAASLAGPAIVAAAGDESEAGAHADPNDTLFVVRPAINAPAGDPLEGVTEQLADIFATGLQGSCASVLTQVDVIDILGQVQREQALGAESGLPEALAGQIGRVPMVAHASVGRIGETYIAQCGLVDSVEMRTLSRQQVRGTGEPASALKALEACGRQLKPAIRCGRWEGSLTVTVMSSLRTPDAGDKSPTQSQTEQCSATRTFKGTRVEVNGRFSASGDYFAPASDNTGVADDVRGNHSGSGNLSRTIEGGVVTYKDGTYLLALDGVGIDGPVRCTMCDGGDGACDSDSETCFVPGINVSGELMGGSITGEEVIEDWETETARYSARARWAIHRVAY